MLCIIEMAQPLCDGDVFRLCLHKRLSDHQLDDIVDIDGVVEEGLLILQLLATEEEPLAWEIDFHPVHETVEGNGKKKAGGYKKSQQRAKKIQLTRNRGLNIFEAMN